MHPSIRSPKQRTLLSQLTEDRPKTIVFLAVLFIHCFKGILGRIGYGYASEFDLEVMCHDASEWNILIQSQFFFVVLKDFVDFV